MIVDWNCYTGFAGCVHEGEVEVPDDATEEEINEAVFDDAMNFIEIGWKKRESEDGKE